MAEPDIAPERLPKDLYALNFSPTSIRRSPSMRRWSKATAATSATRRRACRRARPRSTFRCSSARSWRIMQKAQQKQYFRENILGGMCARVCPTETLCEEACVRDRRRKGKPVKIGQLQRFATDAMMSAGEQPFARAAATGKRIAVVGAGPAGLACAHRLAMHGHDVTIYEAREKSGGLNEYGIAAYKTVDDFAQAEVDYILGIGGIAIEHGKVLGKDFTLNDLRRDYDAVFLGMGLQGVNALKTKGEDADGVGNAIDYIAALRQADDLGKLPVGRRVAVIGGGMTAIDIAVQTKLLGAEDVTILYRRGPEQMKASGYEQELAQTKGVKIKHWVEPGRSSSRTGRRRASGCEYVRNRAGNLRELTASLRAFAQACTSPPT